MCMIAVIGIGYNAPDHCGRCCMTIHDSVRGGCCKDEHRLIKIDADQQLISTELLSFIPHLPDLEAEHIERFLPFYFSELLPYPINHDPPRINDIAAYILNCVFRI